MADGSSYVMDTPAAPPKDTGRKAPVFQRRPDGVITFRGSDGKDYGYERGELGAALPSGRRTNIFFDRRVRLAEYSQDAQGFVTSPTVVEQIRNPGIHQNEGWASVEQRTEYILRHEYTHFEWDNLPNAARNHIIAVFSSSALLARTRSFGAALISKGEYQSQEATDPSVPCFEYQFAGRTHRYSQEFIINELLAHASIGDMMPRESINAIATGTAPENFQRRSKDAIDTVNMLRELSLENHAFLRRFGLVNNQKFAQDSPTLKQRIVQLGR